jgi:hypothetical protein
MRAETAALSARLREAEAVRAEAEAQVAALHDQAAARAADTDRRAAPPSSVHVHKGLLGVVRSLSTGECSHGVRSGRVRRMFTAHACGK